MFKQPDPILKWIFLPHHFADLNLLKLLLACSKLIDWHINTCNPELVLKKILLEYSIDLEYTSAIFPGILL